MLTFSESVELPPRYNITAQFGGYACWRGNASLFPKCGVGPMLLWGQLHALGDMLSNGNIIKYQLTHYWVVQTLPFLTGVRAPMRERESAH